MVLGTRRRDAELKICGSRAPYVTIGQKGIRPPWDASSIALPHDGQRSCDTADIWRSRDCDARGPPGGSEWTGVTRFEGLSPRSAEGNDNVFNQQGRHLS